MTGMTGLRANNRVAPRHNLPGRAGWLWRAGFTGGQAGEREWGGAARDLKRKPVFPVPADATRYDREGAYGAVIRVIPVIAGLNTFVSTRARRFDDDAGGDRPKASAVTGVRSPRHRAGAAHHSASG